MWILLFLSATGYVYNCNAQSSFFKSFNVANDFLSSNNTFNVKSTIDTYNDEILNISFSFLNGRCYDPKLSLIFEEIDFDDIEEYFLVYSSSDIIANCSGKYQENCGNFSECINNFDFNKRKFFDDGEIIKIHIVKSGEINAFCNGYSMNLNITIECGHEQYHIWHVMKNNNLKIKLYGHITAYYGNILTVIGGNISNSSNNNIYKRIITPYTDSNSTGNSLQFATASWQILNNNVSFFCNSQCSTQIGSILYIYTTGKLLKYNLNQSAWIDTATYSAQSAVLLSDICITNNNTHLFIIGGRDSVSLSPYHNIQSYDIANDEWMSSFSSLIVPRTHCGCAAANNMLYVIAGYTMYGKQATNNIEALDLNTMISTNGNNNLANARIGHKVLIDNKDRLWIIGGNRANIEIFDTRNNTMISTNVPVKYASTISNADFSSPWYDSANNIMFTSGGLYDGAAVYDIAYLSVDVIGIDAYPTPPPTLPPVPTPYPTPIGHYIGANSTFDMTLYKPNDTISFTQIIQSTEDLATDSSFFYLDFKFVNGMCANASLSFKFEEVDFLTPTTEYIDVFYPIYPVDHIAHCTGKNDFNCGTWISCIDRMSLQQPLFDTADKSYNYQISVVKSAEVNNYCNYTINANVTINCGPPPPPTPMPTPQPTQNPTTMAPTSLYTNISHTFDMKLYVNNTVSFTIPVQSKVDSLRDELFFVEFDFIDGECENPRLTFLFEEIDFAEITEFIEIYYPTYPSDLLQRCDGSWDFNCGYFIQCVSAYPLSYALTDKIELILLKSADVGQLCEFALNANVTITCGPLTTTPSVAPSANPTAPQFAFSKVFDLSESEKNDALIKSYDINVHSSIDNGVDVVFNVTFTFINGICFNPYLSVLFEEIDHLSDDEYLEIRYPSDQIYDAIARCDGDIDYNCDKYEHCMSYYDLAVHNISKISDEITIYVVKSAQVNKLCDNSINANITISCISTAQNINMTCPPTPICTPSPTVIVENGEKWNDELMAYLPWILFAVSGFFNFLLLISLIQQCRVRKSIEMRQRMALMDESTQMVTMNARIGHKDFQEIISDASVDYVTMNN